MSVDIGELVGTVSLNDQFSGPINNVAKGVGVAGESFAAITGVVGIAAAAITAATGAVVMLGTRGAVVNDVKDAFAQFSQEAGSTADIMLGELQQGTLGTISNFDLMQMANKALGSGLVESAEDMGILAAGAKLLADRTGGDTAEAFDKLTTAIAKGKTGALKQYGIFVDTKVAVEDYARSINKSVGDLSQQEQATALSQAAVSRLKDELEKSGPALADFGDIIDQGKVAVQNFVDNLGGAIAASPVIRTGMMGISTAISEAFGGSNQQAVQVITGYVNDFAIFLVDAAGVGIEAARFLSNAFNGVKFIFNTVLELLFTGIGKANSALADLAQKGSDLPIIGAGFEAMAGPLRESAELANSLAIGFNQMAEASLESMGNANAMADSAKETLGGIADKMREVQGAGGDLATSAKDAAAGIRDTGEAARMSTAEIKAMEDQTRKGQEALHDMSVDAAQKFRTLQDELTLSNLSGTEARLFQIEQAREKELAGLQFIAFQYPELYEQITAMVEEKYNRMSDAAKGHFTTMEEEATRAGFKTTAELELVAENSKRLYDEMKASGKFSYAELKKAHEKAKKDEQALDDSVHLNKMQQFDIIASSASSILQSLFGKSKALAIVAIIIDTARAIVKTFAEFGWPWGIIPAAAVAAAGAAQLSKVKGTSYAEGSPDMAFMDFGRETRIAVHHEEAIINRAQGATLREDLIDAVSFRDDRVVDRLDTMTDRLDAVMRSLPITMRDAFLFARA